MAINIQFGRTTLSLEVPPERLIAARRSSDPVASARPAELYRSAVDSPARFPALHLALTPDDFIAVIVDSWRKVELVAPALLQELNQANIRYENVTFVGPANEEPPANIQGIKTERHDPTDMQHRCYVATTQSGRRVYLNRTVVEADQVVVVSETHYDAEFGTAGGPLAIFPGLADAESRNGWRSLNPPDLRELAEEVSWLLGTVFFIHTIAGPGNSVAQVIGGGPDSFADARKALQSHWKVSVDHRADIVIATLSGGSEEISVSDMVRALTNSLRAVEPGGTIVLCCDAVPELTPTFEAMRDYDSPEAAQRGLKKTDGLDAEAASRWIKAVSTTRVAVLSGWAEEVVEDLFATALTQSNQVQKLVDRGGSVLVIPDAHRVRVAVNG